MKRFAMLALAGASALALAGMSASAALAADDTIMLGAAVSLTGKYSTSGKHTADGYDLAVEKINEMGGVKVGDKTYKIEVKYYDDEFDAGARRAAHRAADPARTGSSSSSAPTARPHRGDRAGRPRSYKVPMVEANGAARSLFTKGYKYIFAVLSTSDQYLSSAVDLAAEKAQEAGKDPKSLRIALAMDNDVFSQDVRAGIVDAAKKYGMQIVIDDKLPDAFNDMSTTLTKVKALKPDLLLVSGHEKGALTAARQIAEHEGQRADGRHDALRLRRHHRQGSARRRNTRCAPRNGRPRSPTRTAGSARPRTTPRPSRRNTAMSRPTRRRNPRRRCWSMPMPSRAPARSTRTRCATPSPRPTWRPSTARSISTTTGKNIGKPMVLLQVLKGEYVVGGADQVGHGEGRLSAAPAW